MEYHINIDTEGDLRDEVIELRGEIDFVRRQLAEREAQYAELRRAADLRTESLERTTEACERLKDEARRRTESIRVLEEALAEAEKQRSYADERVAALRETIASREQELASVSIAADERLQLIETLDVALRGLRATLADQTSEAQAWRSSYEMRIATLEGALAAREASIQQLTSIVDEQTRSMSTDSAVAARDAHIAALIATNEERLSALQAAQARAELLEQAAAERLETIVRNEAVYATERELLEQRVRSAQDELKRHKTSANPAPHTGQAGDQSASGSPEGVLQELEQLRTIAAQREQQLVTVSAEAERRAGLLADLTGLVESLTREVETLRAGGIGK